MINKERVKLRRRKMPSGNISLYLDTYSRGVRKLEYLKLYLIPEKTKAEKELNRQTMSIAEAIRSKRHIELINNKFGFSIPTENRSKTLFFPYAHQLAMKKQSRSMETMLHHLHSYERRQKLTFADLTPKWVEEFMTYLDDTPVKKTFNKRLHPNSKRLYLTCLKTIIHHAKRKGITDQDPTKNIKLWKTKDSTRQYLTLDEVRRLVDTECDSDTVKRAFLFACITGLRRSDVERLRWGDVQQQGEFTRIIFRQKKTGGLEYLDISQQARELMGERQSDESLVFGYLFTTPNTNRVIQRWISRAGINKKITFHCARHTFAIMMLDIGTDIYTVSKLLGHRKLATTQIYARILDKHKQQAIANIPNILKKGKDSL